MIEFKKGIFIWQLGRSILEKVEVIPMNYSFIKIYDRTEKAT